MTEEDFNPDVYCMVAFGVAVGISQILIAFTIMSVLMYCLDTSFADVHIFLCAFGFFLVAEGILTMNLVSGCLDETTVRYRMYAHAFLQLCAVVFIVAGTILVDFETGNEQASHAISGIITTALAVLTMFGGIASLNIGYPFRIMHTVFGITTFLTSSVCFYAGIRKPKFETWVTDSLPGDSIKVIIMFICVYTTLLVSMACLRLVSRFKINKA